MSLTGQTNLSIKRTKLLLKHNFRQFIEYGPGNYLPLSLWGHSGVGKTSLVNQVIKELMIELSAERGVEVTIGFRSFQMSAMQPFELSGYPFIDEDGSRKVQKYATPDFLIEADKFDYFFCFFDEWNRARTEMHNAFMGYIDGRGVNGHKIPKNMFCMAAANPVTEDSSYGAVTDVDDQAILDRLIHINVVPTASEFSDFLFGEKRSHEAVQSFLEEDKDRLPNNTFKGITGSIRKTNRGYTDVGKAVTFLSKEKNAIDRKILIEALSKGIIGDQAGSLFSERFGQCEFLTTPEELIIKGSKSAFGKIQNAVGRGVAGENRLDQVSKVIQNVVRFLNDTTRNDLNKTQLKRLNKLLDMVPQDMKEQVLTKAKFREGELLSGLKVRTEETLQVTSNVDEDITWR